MQGSEKRKWFVCLFIKTHSIWDADTKIPVSQLFVSLLAISPHTSIFHNCNWTWLITMLWFFYSQLVKLSKYIVQYIYLMPDQQQVVWIIKLMLKIKIDLDFKLFVEISLAPILLGSVWYYHADMLVSHRHDT